MALTGIYFFTEGGDLLSVPMLPHAGAPSSGTSGTFAGFAQPGWFLVDTTNSNFYQNTGTLASPTWTLVGGSSSNPSNAAITGGTINGATIGQTTAAAGSFTTLAASGAVTGAGFTALFASPPAIGTTAPAGVIIEGQTAGTAAAAGTVGQLIYGTVTQSVASPITITYGTSPNINCTNTFSTVVPQPVTLATTGSLPTGFSTTTVYWTIPSTITGSVIQLASSVANALAGTAITFSGGSGTQTLIPGCLTANNALINVTGLPLTAGAWLCWGQVCYYDPATGTETVLIAALSTTSGSLPGQGQVINGSQVDIVNASTTELNNTVSGPPIPNCIVNTASSETLFMMTEVTTATESITAYGVIAALRIF